LASTFGAEHEMNDNVGKRLGHGVELCRFGLTGLNKFLCV
jgi:hypothetical protein